MQFFHIPATSMLCCLAPSKALQPSPVEEPKLEISSFRNCIFIVLACLALRDALTFWGDFACYWLCECLGAFAITVSHSNVSSFRNGEQFSQECVGQVYAHGRCRSIGRWYLISEFHLLKWMFKNMIIAYFKRGSSNSNYYSSVQLSLITILSSNKLGVLHSLKTGDKNFLKLSDFPKGTQLVSENQDLCVVLHNHKAYCVSSNSHSLFSMTFIWKAIVD